MKPLDALIQSYMDSNAALAASVAVLQKGKIVYLGGFGTTSVEAAGVPVTPRTLFGYGSISKNICAVLIMRLVERNLLDLDVPISHYLPDLQFSDAKYGRKITLRHLLSHTTGLPSVGKEYGPRDLDSLRRFVYEQIPNYTFLSEPGAVHLYASTVICIAGHIAEAVTGKFYDDLVQEYIFIPLQMEHSTFDPAVAMTFPVALPHKRTSDGDLHTIHRMTYNASGNPSSFAYGSVSDLANLALMYLNQGQFGDQHFLTAASVAEMQKSHTSRHIDAVVYPWTDNYLGYGLGFEIGEYRGYYTTGHGGMNMSYNCYFKLFPDDQAGVLALTNCCDEPISWKMVTDLYDYALNLPAPEKRTFDMPQPIDTHPRADQLQAYAGDYVCVETGELATFTVVDDELRLEDDADAKLLMSVGDDQFYIDVSATYRRPIAFIRNLVGEVAHVMISGEPFHLFEIDDALQPDLTLWQSFEGIYKDPTNHNLDDILTIRLQDGNLLIVEGIEEFPARAISNHAFLSDLCMFEFMDTHLADVMILVWGKATRYYPLNAQAYSENGVIQYLVDMPLIQPRAY